MSKKRSRGKITLADGEEVLFDTPYPVWLARLIFKSRTQFIKANLHRRDGTLREIPRSEIVNLIITPENPRKR